MESGEEPGNGISLEEALVLKDDSMWRQRKIAARALARYATDQSSFEALVEMLDDPDTAVVEEAVVSLVTGGGRRGFLEVLRGLALAEDNVGYHIRDSLIALWFDGVPVLDYCRSVESEEPDGIPGESAREMIQEITGQ